MTKLRAWAFATPSRIALAVATSGGRVCVVHPKAAAA